MLSADFQKYLGSLSGEIIGEFKPVLCHRVGHANATDGKEGKKIRVEILEFGFSKVSGKWTLFEKIRVFCEKNYTFVA